MKYSNYLFKILVHTCILNKLLLRVRKFKTLKIGVKLNLGLGQNPKNKNPNSRNFQKIGQH